MCPRGYTLRAMEHRFSGPSYTLGIEEELMIVDEQTLDLSNSIESLLDGLSGVETEGEVKPELMEGARSPRPRCGTPSRPGCSSARCGGP